MTTTSNVTRSLPTVCIIPPPPAVEPAKLSDELVKAMRAQCTKLTGEPVAIPVGVRMHAQKLMHQKHRHGYAWTALVPVGALAPGAAKADPNEAKEYYIERTGGLAGAKMIFGPFKMPKIGATDVEAVASKGTLATVRTFSGRVDTRPAMIGIGGEVPPGGDYLVLDKPLKIGKAVVSEIFLGASAFKNGEKAKVQGSLVAQRWGGVETQGGVYYGFKAEQKKAKTYGEEIDGKTVKVTAGQAFVLRLPQNPIRGLSWHVTSTDRTFGHPKKLVELSVPARIGSGGPAVLTWDTGGPLSMKGPHKVTLVYGRTPSKPSKTLSFTVEVG